MIKVKSKYCGIVHAIGGCDTRDKRWEDKDVAKVRRSARKHTKDTGHETYVETGTATLYKLDGIK